MTAQHVFNRHVVDIDAACAEGRGKQLVDTFITDMAIDFANTVFLKIETELTKEAPVLSDEIVEWAEKFPRVMGLGLIKDVVDCLAAINASPQQKDAAGMLAATAYQGQLDRLFDTVSCGGGSA